MQLVYAADHRSDNWWPGTFERKRLAQHAILRRATKKRISAVYFDTGQYAAVLVCDGPATNIAQLALDLEDEHVLGFELYGTGEEYDTFIDVAGATRFASHVDFERTSSPPYNMERGIDDPYDHDRNTLPGIVEALVERPY